MPGSFMDIRERLMEAMRSLDVVERDVLSCQTVLHARVGAELEPSNGGVNKLWEGSVVDANLQIVSARRKELGRLWSLDIVELNGSPLVEIERFLEPLPLRDMTVRASDKQTSDEAPLGRGQTPLVSPPQKIVFADVEQKRPAVKRKKIRPREGLQYTPGHISRIFNPEDAIDRVSRSKVVVEVEDDVEDSVGEEEPEEPILRPLSVASTGSNIAVYRPPTPKPDEIAQAVPTVAPRQKKTPPSRPDAPNVRNSSRRKRQTSSDIAIESRGTMDLDQRDGGEDNDRITYVGFVPDAVEVQEPVSQKRFRSPPGSPLLGHTHHFCRQATPHGHRHFRAVICYLQRYWPVHQR
ncbi:uncharacterized protein RCC_10794 [Ramularia collo-cygni]|uniref:Uncharacterized protein n=1 Tax=Ramularia collo-cygni TaxID=112498 RepID=A0A2D3V6P0_9PEZI|nr:uncharacterized protein RCC_10794 [Ramularia collo-cygni]CZT25066.1 uncharacterized protein RCC_10794 [Ramularia collo-cygni]